MPQFSDKFLVVYNLLKFQLWATVITVIIEHILGATLCSKLCTYALYKTHHNRYYLHFIEEETEAFITL